MQDRTRIQKKASIVIVDDEQSILKELRILLGRLYQVHVFANPLEAEVFVDNNEVDLVISDEMMPEMRGSVLLANIHRKYPDICNIVLSGQAEKDDIVKAVNEGHLFSFLYKPTERQQLLNVIEKGLENRNMKLKLAEQNIQLKEYSENLEKMVEEKTAELVKAHDRLNMLDANKMYFLVYLSEEMDSSLDRIQKLAEELLSYFAFAGSELSLNLVPVNLKQTVDSVLENIPGGDAFEINIGAGVQVMADPEYLARIIRVMVDNALVFSDKGSKIGVVGGAVDRKIRLCISDTGKGISKSNLKKVFMPFVISREDRNPSGFGLNLPMTKSIVKTFGGNIWAESDGPGAGAMFCVELNMPVHSAGPHG
jgi:two-component system sensor histidine kinase/response regulator